MFNRWLKLEALVPMPGTNGLFFEFFDFKEWVKKRRAKKTTLLAPKFVKNSRLKGGPFAADYCMKKIDFLAWFLAPSKKSRF